MSAQNHKYQKNSDFINYIEKASEIVQTWPEWKQNLLGTANSSCHPGNIKGNSRDSNQKTTNS